MYPILWRSSTAPSVWDDLFSTRRELDRLFDRVFGTLGLGQASQPWVPVVDVRETADEIQVSAELPGIAPEDVSVTVENGVLTISGEKKQEVVEGKEDANYHLFERRYGRFERSFTLPRTVDAEKVKARFQNGVLHISLPKLQEARPRRVQIEVANGNRK